MHDLNLIKKVFRLFILLLLPAGLGAQTFSERETITRSFKVRPQTTIEVNNKYGKIHVITWKKDSVKFEIDLNLSSNNLSRLNKIKSGIDFDFTSSNYYITAITDFGNSGNQLFAELRNLSDALIPGKNTIEVNYRIYSPESVNLSLINKFGDIYIDDLRGEINISLSNGDMKINSISGEAQIQLNFGNAIINHLTDAKLDVSYSDLNIKQAEKINLISKSSTLNIDDVDLLKLDSRRDKYFVTRVHTIQGSSDFSQIWIENFRCSANLNMKFGNLTMDRIGHELCDIDLLSDYTDISLYLEDGVQYGADVFYNRNAYLTLPGAENELNATTIERSDDELHTFFMTRDIPELPKIKIQALQKCYLNIIVK